MYSELSRDDGSVRSASARTKPADKKVGALLKEFEKTIPKLSFDALKGDHGRVAIIGGSVMNTGAPFNTAMTTLLSGADQAFIFTSNFASFPIECNSPLMVVHPVLHAPTFVDEFIEKQKAYSSIVIGPGLGLPGETMTQKQFNKLIKKLKKKRAPIVITSDALEFLMNRPKMVAGYKEAILAPNIRELRRLYMAVFGTLMSSDTSDIEDNHLRRLALELDNVTIHCKNDEDKITDGHQFITFNVIQCPKRCSGYSNFFSGVLGTCLSWSMKSSIEAPTIAAALAASVLSRRSAQIAYDKFHVSTLAKNLIQAVPDAFKKTFPKTCVLRDRNVQ